jgi:hypothetical protein
MALISCSFVKILPIKINYTHNVKGKLSLLHAEGLCRILVKNYIPNIQEALATVPKLIKQARETAYVTDENGCGQPHSLTNPNHITNLTCTKQKWSKRGSKSQNSYMYFTVK